MILLKTLGTPALRCDGGLPGAGATQRRPLALLALLAVAGERGMSRDKLITFLWPERDEERARHVMAQTLYALRRDLAGTDVVVGTTTLRLNPEAIQTDVAELEDAFARGDAEAAATLYDGPFLDGFHLSDSPEFDQWLDTERARLKSRARLVFERAARAASAGMDHHRAVEWWRRAAALDALDTVAAVGLMEALAAAGDRAGALRHARVYEVLVRDELGVAPDAAVATLVERLRASGPAAAGPRPVIADRSPASPEPAEVAAGRSGARDTTGPPQGHARRWPLRVVLPAAAVLGAVVLLGARAILVGRASSRPSEGLLSAVGAVRDYSGSDSSGIARALTDMLATNLARVPGVRVVSNARIYEIMGRQKAHDELAARLAGAARQAGAAEIVEGTLIRQGSGVLRFDIRRVDLATGAIRKAYSVEGSDPFELVDRATAEFASDVNDGRVANLRIADVTTRSLVAYRFYEQGLDAYYQKNDKAAARRLFLAALTEDSTFAMAEYYAANCDAILGMPTWIDRFEHAAQLAARATDRERLLIRAMAGYYGNRPSYRVSAESLATRYPTEPDGHFLLGQALAWGGDFLASVPHFRRVVEMDSSSLRGASESCRACIALDALVNAYWLADSMAAAERIAREWTRLQPGSPRAWSLLQAQLMYQGREEQARDAMRMVSKLQGTESYWPRDFLMAIRRGDFVTADSILRRPGIEHGSTLWYSTLSLRNQGRLQAALRAAREMRPSQRGATAVSLPEAIVLFDLGRFREAAAAFAVIAATPSVSRETSERIARDRAWNLTHEATALTAAGDTAAVRLLADSIKNVGALSMYGRDQRLHHYVRGLLLRARGQLPAAVDEFRRGIYSLTDGYTRNSYELARSLLALHRPEEAIAVLRPAFNGSIQASNSYITHTELHELTAQAFEQAGQPDSAATHYRYVVRAWTSADSPFRARRDSARARLAALTKTD